MGIGTCKRWNDGTGCEGTLVRSLDCLKKEEGKQGDLLPPKEGGGGDNANNVNAAAKPGFCTPKGGGNAPASSYLSVPDCGCSVDAGKWVCIDPYSQNNRLESAGVIGNTLSVSRKN